jgi:3-isopropylmalate/(R)-2-methylmalate dehydratase small subunit
MHAHLFALVAERPDAELTVDLEAQVVHLPGDTDLPFEVDPFAKVMLLAGTDELGYLLGKERAIAAYEAAHPPRVDTRAAERA